MNTARSNDHVRTAQFHINAALFEELGERLVSKPEIALAELIKNSYDADASKCTIEITETSITVIDDGHGLTEQQFLSNWMVVSSQQKAAQRFSRRFGRSMAGSKGVGRFSARFLGNWLGVDTVATDPATKRRFRLVAIFDWKEIAKARDLNEIVIKYTIEEVSKTAATGTQLTIRDLREHVADLPEDRVRSDVLRLVDPNAGLERPPFAVQSAAADHDPGFRVTFGSCSDEVEGEEEEEGEYGGDKEGEGQGQGEVDLATSILAAYVARARVEVSDDGKVDLKIFWKNHDDPIEHRRFSLKRYSKTFTADAVDKIKGERDGRGMPLELAEIPYLPLASELNSPVFMDLRFFPGRKGTFANLPTNGKRAQSWVKENSGLAIVDNGFAMPAYADPTSDWLAVEASKSVNQRHWQSVITPAVYPMDPADARNPQRNPMLALPRMSQMIGRIHISTRKTPDGVDDDAWLQPNMDREQLRSNGAYRLLWHLTRFVVESIAYFDRKLRLEEEEKAEEEARKQTRASLAAAITQIKTSTELAPDHKVAVLKQLKDVEQQVRATETYERNARLSLELMSLMGVMAGFMTHEFDKALHALATAAHELRRLAKQHPSLAPSADLILRNEKLLSGQADYMRLFVTASRKAEVTPFKAKSQLALATGTLSALAQDHKITFQIDVDPKLLGPAIPLAAYHGVAVNLASNAMKALVARVGGGPRTVRLFAVNEGTRHVLVCADNGVGVPEFLRDRIWDPLFTTTNTDDERNPLNSGLGLGLAVVRRVVDSVGGRIELMRTPPPGFVTAFRATFPLTMDS